jgi:hypothetical protein
MTNEEKIAHSILKVFEVQGESDAVHESLVKTIAQAMIKRCGEVIPPNPGESLAVSVGRPKTAALAYDKVYRIPILNESVPKEMGFYLATEAEMTFAAMGLFMSAFEEVTGRDLAKSKPNEKSNAAENERTNLRLLCKDFEIEYGIIPTIFYENLAARNEEFRQGKSEVLSAAISNVAMVSEQDLSWEQIIEFRKDSEARLKYRRFVRWVDAELRSKSPKEVEDLIALRLDDYEWAIKKHGLKTLIGNLSCLLDPKFLGGTSATITAAALAGGEVWAALAGTSLAVGKVALNFGTSAIDGLDQRRQENYEVAYVHEVKKKFS